MTLSESQAMDSFDFLTNDDAELIPRFSRASFSDTLEGQQRQFVEGLVATPNSHLLPINCTNFLVSYEPSCCNVALGGL